MSAGNRGKLGDGQTNYSGPSSWDNDYYCHICLNIYPGFYFLQALETQHQNTSRQDRLLFGTGVHRISASTNNQNYKKTTVLTSPLAVSSDFSAIPTVQKHWKQDYRKLHCASACFYLVDNCPCPYIILSNALNCHTHSWHPAFIRDPAFDNLLLDRYLFGGGFCSNKCNMLALA